MIEATPLQAGDLGTLAEGVNWLWILVATFLIFFMHAGFAMLEAGQVRAKNVANQLTKNMLTWSIGVVTFFLLGAGISGLVGGLTGSGEYGALTQFGAGNFGWIDWLYGAVFAMTMATIVSGAVAGRAKLRAYVTYTFLVAAAIYPVVTGLTWAGGFVQSSLGFHDFAGGMVVHGVGGIAGLTAAYVLGPRIDRFETGRREGVRPPGRAGLPDPDRRGRHRRGVAGPGRPDGVLAGFAWGCTRCRPGADAPFSRPLARRPPAG